MNSLRFESNVGIMLVAVTYGTCYNPWLSCTVNPLYLAFFT